MRWGKSARGARLQGAPRGIKFALGENPKRSNFRVPGERALSRPRAWASRSCCARPSAGAQDYKARVGGVRGKLKAAGPRASGPWRRAATCELETLRDILDGKVLRPRPLLPRGRDPDADPRRRRVRLQDPHLPARARGLQGRERDRAATARARPPSPTGGRYKIEACDAIPYNAAIMAAHGVNVSLNSDSDELRAAPLLGGGQGRSSTAACQRGRRR